MARLSLLFAVICAIAVFHLGACDDPVPATTDEVETDNGGEVSPLNVNDDGFTIEDSVLVLTTDNFDKAIELYKTILVEFYAPWCGHCKSLAPVYSEAAKILSTDKPRVVLAKVDATVETSFSERFGIQGYPTLKIFKNGKDYEYDGERTALDIVNYMKNVAEANWAPEPDAVITLTKHDFQSVVDREELMLVEFYAPWCGHCKEFAPEYEKAAKALKKHDPPIILAKVDAAHETELAQEYEISGYPTLKVFKKGKQYDYNGGRRSAKEVVAYMQNQVGDGFKLIDSVKMLKGFFNPIDIAIIGFFDSPEDDGVGPYKHFTNEQRNAFHFGIVYDKSIREAYNIKKGSIVLFGAEYFYTKFEPTRYTLETTASTSVQEIKDFILEHYLPLVGFYNGESQWMARYKDVRPLCLIFYTVDFSFEYRKATQMWRNRIAAIAKDYPDITFAVAKEDYKLMKQFHLEDSMEELTIGIYDKSNKRYAMDAMDDYDEDHIREFLDNFKNGKLTPAILTQLEPKRQEGPVIKVVGTTFERIVMDPTKDVLVEIYAPWCGHCKQFEPIYNKLGAKFKSVKNLVIAKLDGSTNNIPVEGFKVPAFPSIFFALANDKANPIKYEGARTLEELEKFIKAKATVSLSDKDEL